MGMDTAIQADRDMAWADFCQLGAAEQAADMATAINGEANKAGWQHVYQGDECRYVNDTNDGPACLVGRALYALGCPLDVLKDQDAYLSNGTAEAPHVAVRLGLHPTTGLVMFAAQGVQDRYIRWGIAAEMAQATANALVTLGML